MNRKQITNVYILISILLTAVVGVVIYLEYGVWYAYYGALSITLLVLYVFDKLAAMIKTTRVPEIVLHTYAILGGFVGGWAGMALVRHKKNTMYIVLILVASTLTHLGGYLYLIQ